MQFVKHTGILLFTLSLFVGSVGISVFKHICEEEGMMLSYMVNQSDEHCGDDEVSCCTEEKEEENDCCRDEFEFHSIKLDFHHSVDIAIPVASANLASPFFVYEEPLVRAPLSAVSYCNPPPPDGRKRLTLLETWII